MANAPLHTAVEGLKRSLAIAMKDTFRSAGMSSDRYVRMYDRLPPRVLKAIAEEYGPEEFSHYVREMELRKMKNA
jgi:hypothetical protein